MMKQKTVTRKMLCFMCVLVMVFSLMGCGNGSDKESSEKDSQTESQTGSEMNSEKNSETQKDTESQTETGTDNATESETGTQPGETESTTESQTESQAPNNSENPGNTQEPTETDKPVDSQKPSESQKPDNSENPGSSENPNDEPTEVQTGEGSTADNPVIGFYGEDLSLTTIGIKGGNKVYYDIYRVGGMYLKIKDADAYVVYNNKTYEAKNGVVTVKIGEALASHPVRFEIGNKSKTEKTFKLQFSNPLGSYQAPEQVATIGTFECETEKNNSAGYYYKYVAEKAGTMVFYVDAIESSTKNITGGITVTNNRNSKQITTNGDGVTGADGKVRIELEVAQGDEILVQVYVNPTSTWKYPAATITWVAEYK